VKLIAAGPGKFDFQMERREKMFLVQIVEMYPLAPAAHWRLSKSEDRPEDQKLLEETLAAGREEHKKQVREMVQSRFVEQGEGYRLSLTATQMEWLLQVLNDVRVGSWLLLGSPDGPTQTLAALNEKTARYFWAGEVAGRFQMFLLDALNGVETSRGSSPES
jgi:hypothetical protein